MKHVLAWSITALACYVAFGSIHWGDFWQSVLGADFGLITATLAVTCLSYVLRTTRWRWLLTPCKLNFLSAYKVLILGFFMNNILPARMGEFVRAHVAGRLNGTTRTSALASIVTERLIDGLTLSLFFTLLASGLGGSKLEHGFRLAALMFLGAGVAIVILTLSRPMIISVLTRILPQSSKWKDYFIERSQIFLDGLKPILSLHSLPTIIAMSVLVWSIELTTYYLVSHAFSVQLTWPQAALFMVAVNFSSLIPSAPGAIGVIEAVGSAALVAVGVDRELALAMTLTQHIIQYIVVGIPGIWAMISLGVRGKPQTNQQNG